MSRGHVCAFLLCKNRYGKENVSFFRFPKEVIRLKQWVEASGREDLRNKDVLSLHNNYRVCSEHFPANMICKNRLAADAVPLIRKIHIEYKDSENMQFSTSHSDQSDAVVINDPMKDHTYTIPLISNKSVSGTNVDCLQSIDASDENQTRQETEMSKHSKTINTALKTTPTLKTSINGPKNLGIEMSKGSKTVHTVVQTPSLTSIYGQKNLGILMLKVVTKTVDAAVQTSSSLSSQSPDRIALLKKLKCVRQKLRRNIQRTERGLDINDVPREMFLQLADKFLPPQTAALVKLQVLKSPKKRKSRMVTVVPTDEEMAT